MIQTRTKLVIYATLLKMTFSKPTCYSITSETIAFLEVL